LHLWNLLWECCLRRYTTFSDLTADDNLLRLMGVRTLPKDVVCRRSVNDCWPEFPPSLIRYRNCLHCPTSLLHLGLQILQATEARKQSGTATKQQAYTFHQGERTGSLSFLSFLSPPGKLFEDGAGGHREVLQTRHFSRDALANSSFLYFVSCNNTAEIMGLGWLAR